MAPGAQTLYLASFDHMGSPYPINHPRTNLPDQPVRLAVVVAKVCHLAVDDVHAGLSHVVSRRALAILGGVNDDLRDRDDEGPPVVVVCVVRVFVLIPREDLGEPPSRRNDGREERVSRLHTACNGFFLSW